MLIASRVTAPASSAVVFGWDDYAQPNESLGYEVVPVNPQWLERTSTSVVMRGLAVPYNRWGSATQRGRRERVQPSAYLPLRRWDYDVVAVVNHESDAVLGCVSDHSLMLSDTEEGVVFTLCLRSDDRRPPVRRVLEAARQWGRLGVSVMHLPFTEETAANGDVTITEAELRHVGILLPGRFPVYDDAHATLKEV